MSSLEWVSRRVACACRVCGFTGDATTILEFDAGVARAEATRCPACGSIMLLDEILGSSPDDSTVDDYIVSGAGIGTIAALVEDLPSTPGGRMLDVGCGYGFALDYARWRHGWTVVGVEPSYAGVRGARDLGLDIRLEPLSATTEVGDEYDVVISSEVLEHVTDPLSLLLDISSRMSADGLLVLTTPDAAVIDPSSDPADVISALSPGYHVFLASTVGLERLLAAAGFTHWRITRTRVSHEVVARKGDGPLPSIDVGTSPVPLVDYLRGRAAQVANPILRAGLLTRTLRELVAAGRLREAHGLVRRLRSAVRAAFRVDIRRVGRVRWPHGLAGCAFALGMLELLDGDPARAVHRFDEAVDAAQRRRAAFPHLDLDTLEVESQSRYHRLLALARVAPAQVPDQVSALRTAAGPGDAGEVRFATWTARLFVELAARGNLDAARELLAPTDLAIARLATVQSPEGITARRDALICREVFAPAEDGPAPVAVSHYIDVFWGDSDATYLSGWLHHEGEPGDDLVFRHGAARFPAIRTQRPDLRASWPDAERVTGSGFTVVLDGPPPSEVTAEWREGESAFRAVLAVPRERRPAVDLSSEEWGRLAQRIAEAPDGPVLLLGARRSDPALPAGVAEIVGGRRVVGLDIHPGVGVDIVADAHRLSAVVDAGTYPVIVSASLLEHVSAPWLVALEIARVLPPGGLAVHAAPWTWPSHAEPNDFWRFSRRGLEALFAPALGFRIEDSGGSHPVVVVPVGDWRRDQQLMPTTSSPSMSWLCAVRVNPPDPSLAWLYDEHAGRALAERYPIDGIVPRMEEA